MVRKVQWARKVREVLQFLAARKVREARTAR